jgi:putative methanogenesis marker protein 2
MDLKKLASEIRDFEGVRRKVEIGSIARALGIYDGPFFGDDAAVFGLDEKKLLFACDSINERLIEADPFFAGYSAVLVNVNDIAALGGTPLAMVDSLSATSQARALEIARGVREASLKFDVPVVGGHFNPNSRYDGIEISILGEAEGRHLIRGTTAKPVEEIIIAIDLDGELHTSYPFAWDSTSKKSAEKLRESLKLLVELAEGKLVSSGRDISNPGIIGTIGMLLDGSGVGGKVDLEKIPIPLEMDISHWLKIYPGFGFVFTTKKSKVRAVLETFRSNGISCEVIGKVSESPKLLISWGGDVETLFNFENTSITGD